MAELQRAWSAVRAGQFRAGARLDAYPDPGRVGHGTQPVTSGAGPAQTGAGDRPRVEFGDGWIPPGPVIPVLGSAAAVGASTLAVAVAEAFDDHLHRHLRRDVDRDGDRDVDRDVQHGDHDEEGDPRRWVAGSARWSGPIAVRVVECGPPGRSGLMAAATAELGPITAAWSRGRRGRVLIDRAAIACASPGDLPAPPEHHLDHRGPHRDPRALDEHRPGEQAGSAVASVTVLDVSWDLEQILACRGWLSEQVLTAPVLVLAGVATVPGVRHLDRALTTLTGHPPGHPPGDLPNYQPGDVSGDVSGDVTGRVAGPGRGVVAVVRGPGCPVTEKSARCCAVDLGGPHSMAEDQGGWLSSKLADEHVRWSSCQSFRPDRRFLRSS